MGPVARMKRGEIPGLKLGDKINGRTVRHY